MKAKPRGISHWEDIPLIFQTLFEADTNEFLHFQLSVSEMLRHLHHIHRHSGKADRFTRFM